MAHAVGLNASLYDFMLYVSIGLAIALAMKVSGILFVFASLVIPPMVGLKLLRSTKTIFVVSCLVTVVTVPLGLALSYRLDTPSGPTIVSCFCAVFLLAAPISRAVRLR
jgi:zinc transport system permease protein